MSILIEGMEMPMDGNETIIRIRPDGTVLDQYGHHLATTAVPVPPHGPLIDADALIKGIEADAIWKHDAINEYDSGIRTGARAVMRSVRSAPAIIPASGGAEDE